MTDIVSKNLYELLGNDPDQDSDKEPEPPVKVIDKTPARTTKRNAPSEAPAPKPHAGSGRGARQYQGNEGAFRDRNAGSASNRSKPTEDGRASGTYGGRGRGRGGPRNFDRHSRGVGGDSEKQAAHGWGATEGNAELNDEQAGDAIAKSEQKEALTGDGEGAEAEAEAEPEDTSISYADYLSQQAEKKLNLGTLAVRQPNEGSKQDKKWASAKPIAKDEEEDFVAGTGGKAKRERERKQKQVVEIDQRFVEQPREERRGGFRGGRGRGDGPGRGGRGGRGDGGRGRGRGDLRGPPRNGPISGQGASINTDDTNAFPSLGA